MCFKGQRQESEKTAQMFADQVRATVLVSRVYKGVLQLNKKIVHFYNGQTVWTGISRSITISRLLIQCCNVSGSHSFLRLDGIPGWTTFGLSIIRRCALGLLLPFGCRVVGVQTPVQVSAASPSACAPRGGFTGSQDSLVFKFLKNCPPTASRNGCTPHIPAGMHKGSNRSTSVSTDTLFCLFFCFF